jgi:DNA-binding transcriptional LysR family regulator
MDIDLVTLRLFVAVAEELNMTRAAHREHLVLPAASKRLKDLEDRVDAQLLYRHARGVTLTPAGLALVHHARQVLATLDRMGADLSEYAHGAKGHIRVHANTSAIAEFLPEELREFLDKHPLVKVDIEEQVSTAIVRAVADGTADIGIFDAGTPSGSLETYPYNQDTLVVVAARQHPVARRKRVKLAEILQYDFVGAHADSSLHSWLTRAAAAAGSPLKLRVQLRSFDCMCRMIQANLGIGILPSLYVAPNLRAMKLAAVALDEPWAERKLALCVRDTASLPVLARKLIEHLSHGKKGRALAAR